MRTLRERFEQKFDKKLGCWIWTACTIQCGYGQFRVGRNMRGAHRVSYELYKGPIPDGLHVCHECDVRNCVNPDHLFLGTHADNMADMNKKGRAALPDNSGENNGKSILVEFQVRVIRRLLCMQSLTQKEIGSIFGVGFSNISAIKNGRSWNGVCP